MLACDGQRNDRFRAVVKHVLANNQDRSKPGLLPADRWVEIGPDDMPL